MHFSGRSMPRMLVNGKIVWAEVLPRQRAHQNPSQGRKGTAGNLSIHFAGSHIIRVFTIGVDTRAYGRCNVPGGNASNPRPAWWFLWRYIVMTLLTERIIKLDYDNPWGDARGVSTRRRSVRIPLAAYTNSQLQQVIRRSRLRPINVRANEVIPAKGWLNVHVLWTNRCWKRKVSSEQEDSIDARVITCCWRLCNYLSSVVKFRLIQTEF